MGSEPGTAVRRWKGYRRGTPDHLEQDLDLMLKKERLNMTYAYCIAFLYLRYLLKGILIHYT